MIGAADVFVGFVVVYATYLLCKHESVCVCSGLCARLCVPRCIAVILLRTSVCICLLLWVDVCTCVCIRAGGRLFTMSMTSMPMPMACSRSWAGYWGTGVVCRARYAMY